MRNALPEFARYENRRGKSNYLPTDSFRQSHGLRPRFLMDMIHTTKDVGVLTTTWKLVLWYDKVTNEETSLPCYGRDVKDDVFTCRLQFRF